MMLGTIMGFSIGPVILGMHNILIELMISGFIVKCFPLLKNLIMLKMNNFMLKVTEETLGWSTPNEEGTRAQVGRLSIVNTVQLLIPLIILDQELYLQ